MLDAGRRTEISRYMRVNDGLRQTTTIDVRENLGVNNQGRATGQDGEIGTGL